LTFKNDFVILTSMTNAQMTIAEIAKVLGITRAAVFNKLKQGIRDGAIKATQKGRSYLIEVDTLPEDIKERLKVERDKAVALVLDKKTGRDLWGIEKQLWQAADKLRGSIDASEYKHVVLGLLFLKYVSDAFYQRRTELKNRTADPKDKEYYISNAKDRVAIIDDNDQYKGEGVFYIPSKARWDHLRNHAMHHDIGKYLDEAMDAIEAENQKQLKGVLPKIYTRTPLESHILGELVNIFSKIQFDHDLKKETDILGRTYEYFLSQFASAEGKRGGEFYTPRCLVRLIVEILSPYENVRIFDPACGSGGMFVQSNDFVKYNKMDAKTLSFFGQESNPNTYKLAKMNLAIRGIDGNIQSGNSYYEDKFPDLRADFVIANPPFNAEWDPKKLSDNDPRLKYGSPPGSNANFMWIQNFIHHLAPTGMAGFVMANGALAVSGREGQIRKKMIEDDLVDVIIACPPKLFYSVALPVSLWFMTKSKKGGRFRNRQGETLFIDARDIFEQISRKQVIFNNEQIKKIANTARAWRGERGAEKYKNEPGYCKSVKLEEIVKNSYVLTPGRYVGIKEEKDDGVPFKEKMKKLSGELKEFFADGENLERKILENLKKIDF